MTNSKHDDVVEQLDQFYKQAKRQILQNQSAITGLFPSNSAEKSSASIKTSLWAASSIFALYLAYSKRVDNDKGKAHDLGQSVVKCMRGILFAWMRQSEKVESFKSNQSSKHALHLKFDLHSGLANDAEYPHLQIDVVSLYLIFLANFIASGLDIIYCMDEVTFIQNLVYYVERAYRTPDFGGWEPSSSGQQQQQQQSSSAGSCIAPPAINTPPQANQYNQQHYSHHNQHHTSNLHQQPPNSNHHFCGNNNAGCQFAPRYPLYNEPINYNIHSAATAAASGASAAPSGQQHHFSSGGHQFTGTQSATGSGGGQQTETNDWSRTDGRSLEIHATSIGMAKSALEAINGCNLFGGKGANWSIIYSDIDAHSRNRSIFEALLPRESRSKNTDSYLLATISWPCFATHDPRLYETTKTKILRRLRGKYGFKRFLRDPYGTVLGGGHSSGQRTSPVANEGAASGGKEGDQVAGSCQHQQSVPVGGTSVQQESCEHGIGWRDREWSFSSTTSSCSLSQLAAEPPRTKQRKSSYFQRKNVARGPPSGCQSAATGSCASNHLLLRSDSATRMSKRFEHIESEWPLFVCFLIIDGIFKQDAEQVYENEKLLYERLLRLDPSTSDYLMPKYYYVPQELINSEKCCPDSVLRLPSQEGSSADQLYLTGQSILLITRLLLANLVHPNELDPLRRHMPSHDRPKTIGRYSSFQATSSDLVVQTVLIAESIRLQAMMANYGIQTQTAHEVEPVKILSSSQLVKVYEYLGVNEKLGLRGRPSRPIGALGTSKLYRILGQTILCYPLIFEVSDFYLAQDMLLLIDDIQNELNFIGRYWRMSGRPTVCIMIREEHLRDVHFRDLLDLLVQFKNGQLKKSGLRIKTGRLQNLISSSCIEHLDFLHLLPREHLPELRSVVQSAASGCAGAHHPNGQSIVSEDEASGCFGNRNSQQGGGGSSHFARGKRQLCSSSAHNLCTIEERAGGGRDSPEVGAEQRGADDESMAWANPMGSSQNQLDFSASSSTGGGNDGTGSGSLHKLGASSSDESSQNYSTLKCDAIDYYERYKTAPTWPTLVELLSSCQELGGQSQLLTILKEREGLEFEVDELSVERRLERVSQLACQARNWSVVRYCSATLKRSVESLSPWLTSILVNGKQISLGTGSNEKIINNPLTPTEIHTLIYSTSSTQNPCDAVLQQEIALYIGRLISTRPDYFEGILTIRVTNFMSAMRSYLNIKTNERKLSLIKLQQQQQQQLNSSGDSSIGAGSGSLEASGSPLASSTPQQQQQLLDLRIKPADQSATGSGGQRPPMFQLESSPPTAAAANYHEPAHGPQLTLPQIKIEPPPPTQQTITPAAGNRKSYRLRRGSRELVARTLESLSPAEVRKLLVKVLNDDQSLPISDRRQITGELCRVPKDFYDKVWSLLSCTNVGIVIGGKILRSAPILTNMTQDDLNFALKVESIISEIDCPKLRQINVELLMALHVILERNPEIHFESDPLDLRKIIDLSLEKFRSDFNRGPDFGLAEYYTLSVQTTMLYTVRAVFDCLLPIKFKGRSEWKLSD